MNIQFDNNTLDNDYITYLKQDNNMFGENFYLGSTPCNTFTLKLARDYVVNDPSVVTININNSLYATLRLVDKSFDDSSIIYTLEDKMTLFDVNYSAKEVIDNNGGEATLKQILEDICTKCGVELATTTFDGENIKVGIYDSSRTARKYISYIAEINGGYAVINRQGNLELKKYSNTSVKTIDIDECSDFEIGQEHIIQRVVYDNGLIKYEHGTGETLYVQSDNPYMSQEAVDTIYNSINGFSFYSYTTTNAPIDSQVNNGDKITFTDGSNTYPTIAICNYTYNGDLIGGYDLKINSSQQTETGKVGNNEEYRRLLVNQDLTNASLNILSEETKQTFTTFKTINGEDILTNDSGDYPINSLQLDGNSYQSTRSGKNLLKNIVHANDQTYTTNGITFTKNTDGSITANGTAEATANYQFVDENSRVNILAGTYILNGCPSGGSNSTYRLGWGLTGVGEKYDYGNGNTITLSTDTTYYFKITIMPNQTVSNLTFSPMISTTGGEYEPYGVSPSPDYPSEIEVIDTYNLVDKNGFITGERAWTNGIIGNNSNWSRTNYIKIKPSTSYFVNHVSANGVAFSLWTYDKNKTPIQSLNAPGNTYDNEFIFVTPDNAEYIIVNYNYRVLENEDFILIESTEAQQYLPYGNIIIRSKNNDGTQTNEMVIPLQGNFIGKLDSTIKDELQILNGNIMLTKRIGKVVLNGTEHWRQSGRYNGSYYITIGTEASPFVNCKAYGLLLSNYFIRADINSSSEISSKYHQGTSFIESNTGIANLWYDDGTATLDDFKAWLATNNVIVYYELEEPYTINLGRVDMLQTYDNISYISQLDNLKGDMLIEYQTNSKLNENYASRDELNTNIDGINNNLSNYVTTVTMQSQLDVNKQNILAEVSEGYVTTGDLNTYKGEVSTALDLKADSAQIRTITNEIVTDVTSGMQTTINNVEENFTFDTSGMTIGRSDSQMKLNLQNDKIKFIEGSSSEDEAYMTPSQFVLQELQEFRLGKFAFIPRSNGSLDFKKVN